MKITVFTNSGIRHNYLINKLGEVAEEVYAIKEISKKNSINKSNCMNEYFKYVSMAEKKIFKNDYSSNNIHTLEVEYGNLTDIDINNYREFFNSDLYIVFGSSYIKEPLISLLINNKCINLHMGVSPYYRGSACNFWALTDGNYDKIGGTIHYISKGLDSGDILKTIVVKNGKYDKFEVGMIAVKDTIDELIKLIKEENIFKLNFYKQDKSTEIRNSKINDFNDQVAKEFLKNYYNNKFIIIE